MGPIRRSLAENSSKFEAAFQHQQIMSYPSRFAHPLRVETFAGGRSWNKSYMTVHRPPRSRMISVRLCEDEYQSLQRLCAVNGSRSLSNFAREAMQSCLNSPPPESIQRDCMNELEARFSKLDKKIEELCEMITSSIVDIKS